jgi:Domain of unknown function (DUF6265)
LPLWIAALATVGAVVVAFTWRVGSGRNPSKPPAETPIRSNSVAQELPGPEGGVLAELNWLVGTWLKVEPNGAIHEMQWGPSYHHSMSGTMRSLQPGHDPEYIFLLLEEDEAGVRLHYRELGSGSEAAEDQAEVATLALAEHDKGRISFARDGREFPLSVELRAEDGELDLTLGAYCELGGLYTGRRYDRFER